MRRVLVTVVVGVALAMAACVSNGSSNPSSDAAAPLFDSGQFATDAALSHDAAEGGGSDDAGQDGAAPECITFEAAATGCSYSVTGAATGSGGCEQVVAAPDSMGSHVIAGIYEACTPILFFTIGFSTATVTPGTYTQGTATVSGAQSGFVSEGTVWREWTQPAPAEGSFSLTISSVGDVIDDAGTRPVHGSFTGVFPITTTLQTDAGTVTGQATF